MAGEEEQKKGEGKGFAGLSSLVSDVDTTPLPPAAKKEPTGSAAPHPAPRTAQLQPSQSQTYQEPAQPSSGGSSGVKWVLGIAAGIGVLWFMGQSNKNTTSSASAYPPPAQSYSSPAQPQMPTRSAQSKPSPVNTGSDLMSGGNGAVYRVPSFRVAELMNYKQAAESAQEKMENLERQVERQKNELDDERPQVDQAQQELDALGDWIERQRSLIDDTNPYEIDSFNSKVRQYNSHKNQLQNKINNFNNDVNSYNALLQRARVAEQSANQMVDGYNSKLEQYGTRQ